VVGTTAGGRTITVATTEVVVTTTAVSNGRTIVLNRGNGITTSRQGSGHRPAIGTHASVDIAGSEAEHRRLGNNNPKSPFFIFYRKLAYISFKGVCYRRANQRRSS